VFIDAKRTDAIGYYTAELDVLAYYDGVLVVDDATSLHLGANQLMVRAIADGTDIVVQVRGAVGSTWDWKLAVFFRDIDV